MVVILCFVFLGSLYGKILLNPNQYLFGNNDDGIKNYYTYVYFAGNNHSNVNFEGFNYPYGEHFFYVDCQPGIAMFFKSITSVFPGIAGYYVGILNLMMLGSFVVGAIFLFLVFMELQLPVLLGALCSVSLMILAPQVFRMTGHYGLSYGCFIPITLYLLLKFENSKRKPVWAVFLAINSLVWFLIHAYLGMILTGFLFLYGLMKLLSTLKTKSLNTSSLWLCLPVMVPFIFFYAFVKLTDRHAGRSTNPYGFFEYYADFDTVFMPHHGALRRLLKNFLPAFTQTWEGWAYIGLIAMLFIGISLVFIFYSFVKSKTFRLYTGYFNHPVLQRMLVAACILLLFSFGFPFRFGLRPYLEYFPMIKQFRSIGRFAWIFYFLINISAIYFVGRWVQQWLQGRKKPMAYLVMVLVPVVIGLEGLPAHREVSRDICQTPNLFNQNNLPPEVKQALNLVNQSHYQAIIPLPYYCLGSENFEKHGTPEIFWWSMIMSYHAKLPIMGGYMARSSIMESKTLIQMLTKDFYPQPLQNILHSELPFLVIYTQQPLVDTEEELFKKSRVVLTNQYFVLAEINKQDLFANGFDKEIDTYQRVENDLINRNGFLSTDTTGFIFYNGFDDRTTKHIFRGTGGYMRMKNGEWMLAEINANSFKPHTPYIASIWMYNSGANGGQDQLTNTDFICRKMVGENPAQEWKIRAYNSLIINDNWTLVEVEFIPDETPAMYEFIVKGYDYKDREAYADELFIYPKGSTYYRVEELKNGEIQRLFMNNHEILPSTAQ